MTTFSVTPLFNETSRFEPYSKGDKLTISSLAFTDIEADDPETAANEMFRFANSDHRPNAATERSLSVGDVVIVEWFDYDRGSMHQERFACEPIGWRSV